MIGRLLLNEVAFAGLVGFDASIVGLRRLSILAINKSSPRSIDVATGFLGVVTFLLRAQSLGVSCSLILLPLFVAPTS